MTRSRFPAAIGQPGPGGPMDQLSTGGGCAPDDGGMSKPEPGCAAGPRLAHARGLRAGGQPADAHRQGPQASGHVRAPQRGVLPSGGTQAAGQQADGLAAVSGPHFPDTATTASVQRRHRSTTLHFQQ